MRLQLAFRHGIHTIIDLILPLVFFWVLALQRFMAASTGERSALSEDLNSPLLVSGLLMIMHRVFLDLRMAQTGREPGLSVQLLTGFALLCRVCIL
jgi:hypothetical protein